MIRSSNKELGEYALVREAGHIAHVWKVIETSLPKYWDRFVKHELESDPKAKLLTKHGGGAKVTEGAMIATDFEKAVESYEKEAEKYRKFFDPDAIEEFHDDPNAFKQGLTRDVPVIANTLRQRHAELKEWQMHFRATRPKDLLEVFSNVLDFRAEWSDSHSAKKYCSYDAPDDFELSPLDDDESMSIVNVVGMGIKSIILYHLDATRFPSRGRNGLYGLFFLSGREHFGLPSDSSEFLMINDLNPASDGSIIMDQNYWYPYDVFSVYLMRIYRWIEQRGTKAGFEVDSSVRHVYVERFFHTVCDLHADDLKTMCAHERFEVPA